jgi:protein SCO1/2
MNFRKAFIVFASLAAITAGAWFSFQLTSPPPAPGTATVLPATSELPEFSLLDQNGKMIGRDVFEGQWDLLFFGFTQCPDICPTTLQVLADAQRQLANAGQQPLPRIVLVSVDPERDTPDVIGQYVGHFGDDSLGITGPMDELRKLTNGLGIFFEKSGPDEENYSVAHSAVVLLIDPDGRFHSLFGSPHKAENFVHDLPIIMSAR